MFRVTLGLPSIDYHLDLESMGRIRTVRWLSRAITDYTRPPTSRSRDSKAHVELKTLKQSACAVTSVSHMLKTFLPREKYHVVRRITSFKIFLFHVLDVEGQLMHHDVNTTATLFSCCVMKKPVSPLLNKYFNEFIIGSTCWLFGIGLHTTVIFFFFFCDCLNHVFPFPHVIESRAIVVERLGDAI